MLEKFFKKKSRAEIISDKSEQIIHDIMLSGLTNNEVSILIDSISKEGKSILENRKIALENELVLTCEAINRL